MKKVVLTAIAMCFAVAIQAQVTTPQSSPSSKVEQKVGLTDVTLEYSRPSVKGRTVFGDLVPYERLWRTGANKNSVITFSDDVVFGGYDVKAGSYAIFTTPGESLTEVILYADTENWGTPQKWDESKVAAIAKAQVQPIPFNVETFTIDINNITNTSASLEFIWEKTYFSVPFEVPTDDKVLASINETLDGAPSANDYYAAAVYYLQENKDIKQAKEWMDKAMSMTKEPQFWQLRQQALIYAKSGDTKGAIELAKKSLEAAKAAENMDYIKMNEESIEKWQGM